MEDRYITELFFSVLESPGDFIRLAELKDRSRQLVDALNSTPRPDSTKLEPSWAITVLDTLAEEELLAPEEIANVSELVAVAEEREAQVGIAFREALVRRLPDGLLNFDNWFGELPAIPTSEVERLLETPMCKWASPYAESLAKHGLSPLSFLHAAQGIRTLAYDALRDKSDNDYVVLLSEQLPRDLLLDEVADMLEPCGFAAERMLDWLVSATEHKPLTIPGLYVQHLNDVISVRRDSRDVDLFTLWAFASRVDPVNSNGDQTRLQPQPYARAG